MIIQYTLEFDSKEYGCDDRLYSAMLLAKAIINGEADWPDKIRIDVCNGQTQSEEFETK